MPPSDAQLMLNELSMRLAHLKQLTDCPTDTDAPAPSIGSTLRLGERFASSSAFMIGGGLTPDLAMHLNHCLSLLESIRIKKIWLQRDVHRGDDMSHTTQQLPPSPSRSSVEPADPLGQRRRIESDEVKKWDALYSYSNRDYLRDLSHVKAFAALPLCNSKRQAWKSLLPVVAAQINGKPQCCGSGADWISGLPQSQVTLRAPSSGLGLEACSKVLEVDKTFQFDGETKDLNSVVELMRRNKDRKDQLLHRIALLQRDYVSMVEWVNRQLVAVDLAIEHAEGA